MASAAFVNLRVNNAEQFRESLSEPEPNTKVYLTFGKTDPWPNDSLPNTPNSSIATQYEIWNNMIGGKRLLNGDVATVIPRFNWEANTDYFAYDHLSTQMYDGNTRFYVVTDDYNVYKCIANNYGSKSNVKPTSISTTNLLYTEDGYVWKYMYTVSDAEQLRFTTDGYIPVKTLFADDGSIQWQVQQAAQKGAINSIIVTDGGTNYSNASNIVISVAGDGRNFSAIASIDTLSKTVSNVTIVNAGSDYTYGTVFISGGGGTGAKLKAIISPPGGHGSNPLHELGGKNVLIDARLKYDEEGFIPVKNDYRQIALLKDPYSKGTRNVASQPAFTQAIKLIIVGGAGNYIEDEIVYQGSSLSAASFRGKVVSWDDSKNELLLINTFGEPLASRTLTGETSLTVRIVQFPATGYSGYLEPGTGDVLYVDNIKPITRSFDQIEDYKIVVKF